jgi:tRNA 2-thiouridine synthesizing protein C
MPRRFLFLMACSPWQPRAQAALDLLLTTAVMDQEVHLCFCGAGVLHLAPDQDGAALQLKTLARQLPALDLYGVTRIYAEREALARYGLLETPPPLAFTTLDAAALAELLHSCDIVERCR